MYHINIHIDAKQNNLHMAEAIILAVLACFLTGTSSTLIAIGARANWHFSVPSSPYQGSNELSQILAGEWRASNDSVICMRHP